jgi:hypothetical protein
MTAYHETIAAGIDPQSRFSGVEPERYVGSAPGAGLLDGRELWIGATLLTMDDRFIDLDLADRGLAGALHSMEVPADRKVPVRLHMVEAGMSHAGICKAFGIPSAREGIPVGLVPGGPGTANIAILTNDDYGGIMGLNTLFHPGKDGHPDIDTTTAFSVTTALVRTYGVDMSTYNLGRPLRVLCEIAGVGSAISRAVKPQKLPNYTVKGPLVKF